MILLFFILWIAINLILAAVYIFEEEDYICELIEDKNTEGLTMFQLIWIVLFSLAHGIAYAYYTCKVDDSSRVYKFFHRKYFKPKENKY